MNPKSRVRWSAWTMAVAALLGAAPGASAQAYEDVVTVPLYLHDPIARDPRLLGLGGLTLVPGDGHSRITLWEFAASPVGILDADTISSFEFGPGTGSQSTVHDLSGGGERQEFAARTTRIAFEAWRRDPGSSVFGIVGDLADRSTDIAVGPDLEHRRELRGPFGMPVLNGALSAISQNLRYAVRATTGYFRTNDTYRTIVRNRSGEFIDREGVDIGPPDFFLPDDHTVRTLGIGAGVGYRIESRLEGSVFFDYVGNRIEGKNEGPRHASERQESRPYRIGQVAFTGDLGRLSWGVDARGWKAQSHPDWAFTLSSGSGGEPYSGRGKLLDRFEEGSLLRTRLRWVAGTLELGAALNTSYRQVEIVPPLIDDRSSFNYFRNATVHRAGADSLAVPDSIVHNTTERRAWDAGVGAAWRLPGGKGLLAAEGRWLQALTGQEVSGEGPKQLAWDVRGGVEYPIMSVLAGRVGYGYRWEDRDDFTAQNEFTTHTMTLGAGLGPENGSWRVESGYAIDWYRSDFGDPLARRGSQQRLETRVSWAFGR